MGDVYLARETASKQLVALKFLREPDAPDLVTRFESEFRALREIVHPNVVRVLGHDFHRADPYFVLEYLEGGSLRETVETGPLNPAVAVELIRKVAGAVQTMHERAGILHRDIKPGNVLLTPEGEPKLADFGLAKFLDAKTVHTLSGAMLGTLRYMPPEQINGQNGELGCPADVYGLGATLYHLLTGRTPFVGEDFGALLFAVLNDLPRAPHEERPELTRGLSGVVMRCLEKDPRYRYQTVAEFIAALDRWADSPTPPPPPPFWRRAREWAKRNAMALSACALLAVTIGAVAAAWPDDPERAIVSGLANGKKRALVKDGKPVPPVRWPIRHPERAEPKKGAGFAVLSQDLAVGVILNDPGITSYKLSGRFRQEVKLKNVNPQADATARTGLLIGHAPLDFGNGRVAHFATIVTFNDFDDAQNLNEVRRLEHEDFVRLELPLDSRRRNRGGLTLKLTRFEGNERPWREFAVEVRPTGLTINYNGQQTVAPVAFIQKNWDANAANLAQPNLNLPAFAAPKWSPRLPLGIVSQMAWSNFDSLDIEPLP